MKQIKKIFLVTLVTLTSCVSPGADELSSVGLDTTFNTSEETNHSSPGEGQSSQNPLSTTDNTPQNSTDNQNNTDTTVNNPINNTTVIDSSSVNNPNADVILPSGSVLFFDFEWGNTSKDNKTYNSGTLTSKGHQFYVDNCIYNSNFGMESGDNYLGSAALRFNSADNISGGTIRSKVRYNLKRIDFDVGKYNNSKDEDPFLYVRTSTDGKTWSKDYINVWIDHNSLEFYFVNYIDDLVYFEINFAKPSDNKAARVNLDNLKLTFL